MRQVQGDPEINRLVDNEARNSAGHLGGERPWVRVNVGTHTLSAGHRESQAGVWGGIPWVLEVYTGCRSRVGGEGRSSSPWTCMQGALGTEAEGRLVEEG